LEYNRVKRIFVNSGTSESKLKVFLPAHQNSGQRNAPDATKLLQRKKE
jgi:hypothetical protein